MNTIADGTAVKTPGETIFPYIQKNLDDIITVTDDELIVAFLDVVENHKMVVENSGLLTVAALSHMNVKGKKIVSISVSYTHLKRRSPRLRAASDVGAAFMRVEERREDI